MTRLNVNLNDETADEIRSITSKKQMTATEAMRRIVSVYKFFSDAQKSGKQIRLVEGDRITEVTII